MGISVGVVLALCVLLLLFLARRNPKKLKKLWLSFVRMPTHVYMHMLIGMSRHISLVAHV